MRGKDSRAKSARVTIRQQARLDTVFGAPEHARQVTHWIYQQIIAAYGHYDPCQDLTLLAQVIDAIKTSVQGGLDGLGDPWTHLAPTRADVLTYFAPPRLERPDPGLPAGVEHRRVDG